MFFEPVKNVQLSPSRAQIPLIKVSSYHLCGRVSLSSSPSDEKKGGHRDVLLANLATGREVRSIVSRAWGTVVLTASN